MKIDYKLRGFNLLKFGCSKDVIVHPETCANMVMMDHDGTISLEDWITSDGTYSLGSSLSEWLTNNLSSSIEVNAAWHSAFDSLTDSNSQNIGYIGTATDNPVRIPVATNYDDATPIFGVMQAGLGLNSNSGIVSLISADTDVLGGVKLGYIPPLGMNTKVALQVDAYGRAYVNVGNVSGNNYLGGWVNNSATITALSYPPAVYVDYNDIFADINLYDDYASNIASYYSSINTIDPTRLYAVRADEEGRMYVYVNWNNTIYNRFTGFSDGLVPSANEIADKTKYCLNASGKWIIPQDTTYNTFTTNSNGLVPKSLTHTTKFLRGDGIWADPQDTTYEGDGETITITNDNTIVATQQLNVIRKSIESLEDILDLSTYKDIRITEQETIKDTTNLEYIFEYIGARLDGNSGRITYNINDTAVTHILLDDTSSFVLAYEASVLNFNFFGDVEWSYSQGKGLEIRFGDANNSSDPMHNNIVFEVIYNSGNIYVNIISTSKLKVAMS